MAEISRVKLFGKLNALGYKAIEAATVFCKMRGNPYVELVHWITQLLETQESDLQAIVRHYGLDPSALARDVTATLDRLPRGSTAICPKLRNGPAPRRRESRSASRSSNAAS